VKRKKARDADRAPLTCAQGALTRQVTGELAFPTSGRFVPLFVSTGGCVLLRAQYVV